MNAEQIAEGRRLEEAATDGPLESRLIRIRDAEDRNWREIFSRGEGLAVVMADWYERIRGGEAETYCGVRIKKADADLFVWLRNHARELLAAAEQLEAIVGLLQLTDYSDSELPQKIREVVK